MNEEQKQFIIENYATMNVKEIANHIGVTPSKVYKFASSKHLKREIRTWNYAYTKEQEEYIIEHYEDMTTKQIMKNIGVTHKDIRNVVSRFKLKKGAMFSEHCTIPYKKRTYIIENCKNTTAVELGETLNLPPIQITNFCKRNDLQLKTPEKYLSAGNLTIAQKRFITENYATMTNEELAKELGVDKKYIYRYASNSKLQKDKMFKKNKPYLIEDLLDRRNREFYQLEDFINNQIEGKANTLYTSSHGKYHVNDKYFETIDNEFKAYWLGFLYADGCVRVKCEKNGRSSNTISIGLKSTDVAHLEKFRSSIQTDNPIRYKNMKGKYESANVTIVNEKMCHDLIALGCVPNKSLILKFPTYEQVPRDLIRHFIRGYFDGDGTIHINLEKRKLYVSFLGTEEFCKGLINVMMEDVGVISPTLYKKKDNEAYSISWSDINKIGDIYKYLYKDCNIYLDRKLEKFDILYCLD